MTSRFFAALLLFPLLLGGCASMKKREQKPAAAAAAPPPRVVGKVALINEAYGFVLIEANETPAPGTVLKTVNPAETGELKMSAERRPPFLIGDIVRGSPGVGDLVIHQGPPPEAAPEEAAAPAAPAR